MRTPIEQIGAGSPEGVKLFPFFRSAILTSGDVRPYARTAHQPAAPAVRIAMAGFEVAVHEYLA